MKINIVPLENEVVASQKEQKIIHVSVLNILSLINGLTTGKEIVLNPIESEDNIGLEVFLSHECSEKEQKLFTEKVIRQVSLFLKMADIKYSIKISK